MYAPVQSCNHCGASLSLDDLRRADCPYCGTVYPHRAQAEQHAQAMGQMMGQVMQQALHMQQQVRSDVASQLPHVMGSSFRSWPHGASQGPDTHRTSMQAPPYGAPPHLPPQVSDYVQQTMHRTRASSLTILAGVMLLVVGAIAAFVLLLLA
ncbi:MAG: hypothetical protein FJ095_15820 [Deltaproteobacteria bacterium]|nr:hypothetical protein [Deltaproteobacteria bacterium]